MYFLDIFGILLMTHIIGDFFIFSPWSIPDYTKERDFHIFHFSWHLLTYSLVVILGLLLIFFTNSSINPFLYILIFLSLIILHLIVDLFTIRKTEEIIHFFSKKSIQISYCQLIKIPLQNLLYNQTIFIIAIFICATVISDNFKITTMTSEIGKFALILSVYLSCLYPSTAIVKRALLYFIGDSYFTTTKNNGSIQVEATMFIGKYLGWVEMVLSLTLVLLSAYDALGLLIVAKTYITFQSNENNKEIFVFGTMLSITISVMFGIFLLLIFKDSSFLNFNHLSK